MGDQITADGMTVGTLADLVGISVRTLHHWDQIGLVIPSGRTSGGYRSYSHDDLGRVHRVLVYRALGVPLAAIAELLDGPDVDGTDQLREQRRLLRAKISELQRMSAAVDALLARKESGERLNAQEQSEIFGSAWRPEWADEAEERWGGTEQWQQFESSAELLTPDERIALGESGIALFAEMASAMQDGVDPAGPAGSRWPSGTGTCCVPPGPAPRRCTRSSAACSSTIPDSARRSTKSKQG